MLRPNGHKKAAACFQAAAHSNPNLTNIQLTLDYSDRTTAISFKEISRFSKNVQARIGNGLMP
jgi:hypothetical protein